MPTAPFAAARLSRRLTLEQAAERAGLDPEQVRSLEENCIYRFGSNAEALAAALVYASALGLSEREARRIAGLPAERSLADVWSLRRTLAVLLFMAASVSLIAFVFRPDFTPEEPAAAPAAAARPAAPPLPARWEIAVDVYNGTRIGNAAAGTANEVAGLAYRIGTVANAPRRDYRRTLVYYPPGARAIAERLAKELGIGTAALPGGEDPKRLVVIVGSERR